MSAANPNPMEKSMVSVLVVAKAGGGGRRCCVVYGVCCRGVVGSRRSPFVVGLVIPPLFPRSLSLHGLPSVVLHQGSGGGIG
jgi:hypothetical protein